MELKTNYVDHDGVHGVVDAAAMNAIGRRVNALAPKHFYVDEYGADPTGVAWSDDAVIAARAAMGSNPGVIVFGAGEYKIQNAGLNTENAMSLGLYQGVQGQGSGVTRIDYRGVGACVELRNLAWEFNTASEPAGGVHGIYFYGWGNDNDDTYGIRYGDINRMRISDVHIAGYNRPGCAGLYGDNWIAWSERADIECSVEQCTICFLFEGRGENEDSVPGLNSSFDYSTYRLTFVAAPNQDGFVLRSRVTGLVDGVTSMNGVDVRLTGNCVNAASGATNTGALFTIGADNNDWARLTGALHINVETSGDADGVAHYDFMQGAGPFGDIRSRVSATGEINLIPISGNNFRRGTASAHTFSFSGLLKHSPALGSTGIENQFQPLQLLAQARGRYGLDDTNATQMIYIREATAGTIRFRYNGGSWTATVPFNPSVSAVQTALRSIPALGDNVTVNEAQPRFVNGFYADELAFGVQFHDGLAETAVSTIEVDTASLTGGAGVGVDVVVRNTGSTNKTCVLDIESGNIMTIEQPPGTYRLNFNLGTLTDTAFGDEAGDTRFGLFAVDVWIKQPTTGGNVVLEGPYFAPSVWSGSVYNFSWIDGQEPVLSTTPDAYDVIRLSTYNFNVWIGQHLTKAVPASIASAVHAASSKSTPIDADEIPLDDSAASFGLKRLTWANLKAAIKSYYDSVTATLTNKDLSSGTNTFPTLNQNTTGSAAKLTTARTIDGQPFDGTANITVIAPGTHAASSKATPADADELPLVDSAASNVLKRLTWANLKAALATALFSTSATASTGAQRDANGWLTSAGHVPYRTQVTSAGGTTTMTNASSQVQQLTGTTTQTFKLPTTGILAGTVYTFVNSSTGTLTLQASDASQLVNLSSGGTLTATAKQDTPVSAAHWDFFYLSAGINASSSAQRDGSGKLSARGFMVVNPSGAITTSGGTTTINYYDPMLFVFTGSSNQTVVLPTGSGVVLAGYAWRIVNSSTGTITVQSSNGNTVTTIAASDAKDFVVTKDNPTTSAHWRAI